MRYGTLFFMISGLPYNLWTDTSLEFCKIWFYIDIILGANLMAIPVFGLLALRTYALYQRGRLFKWILLFLFISINLVLLVCVIIHLATVQMTRSKAHLPGWTCPLAITYASSSTILIELSAPVVYESVIFILTANRVYESWHDTAIVKIIF